MTATREHALRYAERGWPVFPCEAKRPLLRRGLLEASADPATVEQWWARWPEAQVAIRTGRESGLLVLDVDGDAGADALAGLESEHGPLPTTASVRTPRGGQHYYLRHPGGEIRCSAGQLGPGLDIRCDGGYVIAPPSAGQDGRWYEADEQAPVADPPAWLVELVRSSSGQRNGSAPPVGDEIPEGKRNATLASLAGTMRRRGMDEAEILAALGAANARRCQPPLPAAEVETIARSVARYPPASANGRDPRDPHPAVAGRGNGSAGVRGSDNALASAEAYAVTWSDAKPSKLVLPDVPAHDDLPGLCAWLTSVLRLDPQHPVTGAVHQGRRGADGHVEIRRASAPGIRFEPAAAVSSARQMLPILGWRLQPTDGEPYGFKDEHCRRISHVLRLLCGAAEGASEEEETAGIVGTFLGGAIPVEGHTTYGTGPQRYEAAAALQRELDAATGRPMGPPRYLIDVATGELVIRVADLQEAARRHVGSSLRRGWLDARVDGLRWDRVRLDGHALSGRGGRSGPHLRTDVYRGLLAPADDGAVTT